MTRFWDSSFIGAPPLLSCVVTAQRLLHPSIIKHIVHRLGSEALAESVGGEAPAADLQRSLIVR